MTRLLVGAVSVSAVTVLLALAPSAQTADPPAKPTKEQWQVTVDKAATYLRSTQEENGGWSTQKNIGVTGVVVTGLLECGNSPDDEPAAKGLKYIEGLVN